MNDNFESMLSASDTFVHRHIGPAESDIRDMLSVIGCTSLDDLERQTVPESIRISQPLRIEAPPGEHAMLEGLRQIASKNHVCRSMIGMGYHDCITPPVILRNILENPGWYTQYTPYQAEIAQGRLEALINFQTMIADLTGLPLANASLLDEATAAAEAMYMCRAIAARGEGGPAAFFVSQDCHPQTIAVVQTRARPLGVRIDVGDPREANLANGGYFGLLVQFPTTDGRIENYAALAAKAHDAGMLVVAACDPLALTLLKPPGEWGADIAVGSTQRFGVPMGYGGPHAAYMATREEFARQMPGRIIGVSKDAHGKPAYRLSIQTREQHIRREKATSNICTAQVLLAIMAGMYAVYHGPAGLRRIATRVHLLTGLLARGLNRLGFQCSTQAVFDTLRVRCAPARAAEIRARAVAAGINLRAYPDGQIGIALDETTTRGDVAAVWQAFCGPQPLPFDPTDAALTQPPDDDFAGMRRTTPFLTHAVFNSYHSETEMLRYISKLQSRDLSLAHSMIALGSCTMKLNATSEMIPVTWPEFGRIHPYAPADQTAGYAEMCTRLESRLCEITGFAACSLQPNAGSQGEYAGLLAIRAYHESRQQSDRHVCLIPTSAHGTNPASAIIAGFEVVAVACDENGNVDVEDLRAKAAAHRARLGALMITYPSTHGVFEERIKDICAIVHDHGGQVYMDGANMNAQVGLCRPGDIGADVCHLNLHKTFCIPHGGGGPGMGPICVASHLSSFLPGAPVNGPTTRHAVGPVSAAPYGSAGILTIPYVYIELMGGEGLRRATQVAILNANYMARRLESEFDILYRGKNGRVAHEFILDCRPFDKSAGVKIDDIAKRLMDFGFHAPTMSFPVPGTLMIEPTESESKAELDRFCQAMLTIRDEIRAIEQGRSDRADNALKGAPHTAQAVISDKWSHAYSREQAAYPLPWVRDHKFWPAVGRIDNVWGDRNLMCTCVPMTDYQS